MNGLFAGTLRTKGRTWVALWVLLFVLSLFLQYARAYVAPDAVIAAAALKAGTVEGFEVDGDLKCQNATTNPGNIPDGDPAGEDDLVDGSFTDGADWLDNTGCNGVVDPATPPTSVIITTSEVISDTGDDVFIGGAKEDDTRTWGYTTQKPTPKDDINDVMAYAKFVGSSAFFYAGATRIVNNGDTHLDVELDRKPFKTYSDGISKPDREIGDVLVSLEFSNGGGVPIVTVYKVTAVQEFATGELATFGADSATTAAVRSATNFEDLPDQGLGYAIPEFQFAEFSIDLAALGISTSCPGLSNAHIRTRSGGDLDSSQLKDNIPPFPIDLNNCGTVTIIKDAIPDDAQDFGFSGDFSTFSLDDDSDATLSDRRVITSVPPGTYQVTEGVTSGWDLTNIVCSDPTTNSSGNVGTRTATINVAANESVTCTFTNRDRGSITIIKDAVPNDPTDFSYTTTGSGLSSFSLDDDSDPALDNTQVFSNLAAGTYTVTEGDPTPGFDLTNLICVDPTTNSTVNLATRTATIVLAQSEDVTCTFTNTKRGSITIVKDAVPNDAQDFAFTTSGSGLSGFSLDDDSDPTLSHTTTFTNLVPGSYSVTEGALTGWDLTNLVCSSSGSGTSASESLATRTASITLGAGGSVTCTYTNTKRGSITIIKDAVPNDAQNFGYTGDLGAFSLDDDADGTLPSTRTFDDLVPGTYNVTESSLTGWDLTDLVCTSSGSGTSDSEDLATRTASVTLGAGGSATCTFTNTKRGSITIIKDAVPNDAQDFAYTTSGADLSAFSLDDDADGTLDNTTTFSNLVPGSYSVTETAVTGWDLTDLVCTSSGSGTSDSESVATATASITLGAGGSATCTFTNTKRGSITIIKDAVPNDAQDFAYTTSGAGLSGFSLDDDSDATLDNTTTFNNLVPGSYSVTEGALAGWDLTNLVCTSTGSGTSDAEDLATRTASITLGAGGSVTCTYTNTKRGQITIIKDAVPNDAQDFGYSGDLGAFSLDDDADGTLPSSRTFTNLVPGSYSVSEDALTGWDLTNLVCSSTGSGSSDSEDLATRTASITLGAGGSATCTFTNTKRGSITIVKDALPNDAQDFAFTTSGSGLSGFSLDDDADGTLPNSTTFNNLVPGSYSVTESVVASWDLTNLVCVDPTEDSSTDVGTRTASLDLDPGESITCTFTNAKRGTLSIVKDAVPNDAQDFGYTTTGGLSPASFSLDDDADGTLSNSITYSDLVSGSYTVTETAVAGWDLTNLVCDDSTGGTTVDLSTGTASIAFGPGDVVVCTYTNTKRGSITVVKDAVPNDPQDFTYTTTGSGLSGFILDDDGTQANPFSTSRTFSNLVPGAYSVTEADVTGWDLTGLSCTDDSTTNLFSGTASIDLAPGEEVTCTYVNTKRGSITIVKDAVPNSAQDFAFSGTLGAFSLDDDSNATLSNSRTFSNLVPGNYNVTEGTVSGWLLDSVSCSDSSGTSVSTRTASIVLEAGESVTCTFVNRNPTINIVKTVNDADRVVGRGQSLTYSLALSVFNGPVTGSVVSDPLPVGQTFVSASDGGTYSAATRTITWNLGTLASGDPVKTLTYVVTVDDLAVPAPSSSATQHNVATFDTNETPPDSDDETVRVPDLTLVKTLTSGFSGGTDPILGPIAEVGDTLTYTLQWTLVNGPVTGAVLTDVIPVGLEYVAGSAVPAATYNATTRTLTWNLGTLSASGSATYRVTVTAAAPNQPQPLRNVATIDSNETPPDDDDAVVGVNPPPLAATPTPRVTPPQTDAGTDSGSGSASGLGLILLALLGIVGIAGFVAPVPARARARRKVTRR